MTTPYLEGTELAASQVDEYITANELARRLEQAIAGRRSINFASDANYTLVTTAGSEQWLDCFLTFTDTSSPHVLTTGRSVVFPAKSGPIYLVKNSTAQTLTLKITGQTGVALLAGEIGLYYYNGTDIAEVASGGGSDVTIVSPAGTTHTATVANNAGLIIFNSSSTCTLTLPQTSTEALDAGFHVLVMNKGTGNVSIAVQGSDTLAGVSLMASPGSPITAIKEAAGSPNAWRLLGNDWVPGSVVDHTLTQPPTPSPLPTTLGQVYIVNAASPLPAGSWAGFANGSFAIRTGTNVYAEVVPITGQMVYTPDPSNSPQNKRWIGWNGTAWVDV